MNTENLVSLVRNVLTLVGGFLIGKNFLGAPIDDVMWQGLVGAAMVVLGIVLGIKDKTVTIEQYQSAARHVISTIGGILVGAGKAQLGTIESIAAIVVGLIPILQGTLSRKKATELVTGQIRPQQLKGARSPEERI